MEAVFGAVYLDGGWAPAATLIMRLLGERIELAAAGPGGHDYKTRLQELAARDFEELPRYDVTDEGPDHAKRFFATVVIGGLPRGRGEGRSKKHAEQAAAREAWHELNAVVAARAGAARGPAGPAPGEPRDAGGASAPAARARRSDGHVAGGGEAAARPTTGA